MKGPTGSGPSFFTVLLTTIACPGDAAATVLAAVVATSGMATTSSASLMAIRCDVTPVEVQVAHTGRSSVTARPVLCSAASKVSTDAAGLPPRRMAKAPETWAVATEVPPKVANPLGSVVVGTEDRVQLPGASSDMNDAMLL